VNATPGPRTPATPQTADGRFYPLVDCRCSDRSHADNGDVYRMVGSCTNCRGGPFLMLITAGHTKPYDKQCPKCGCYRVGADRLAEDDELPAPVAAVTGRGAADGEVTLNTIREWAESALTVRAANEHGRGYECAVRDVQAILAAHGKPANEPVIFGASGE
jgi:hypothetical protein